MKDREDTITSTLHQNEALQQHNTELKKKVSALRGQRINSDEKVIVIGPLAVLSRRAGDNDLRLIAFYL